MKCTSKAGNERGGRAGGMTVRSEVNNTRLEAGEESALDKCVDIIMQEMIII